MQNTGLDDYIKSLQESFDIRDFKSIHIHHRNDPDSINVSQVLSYYWEALTDVTVTRYTDPLPKASTSDAELQVYLNVGVDISNTSSEFKQIVAVYTERQLFKQIVDTIKEPRDLDKYKTNTIVYTPYSLSEFMQNRFDQAINQSLKGIINLPYLDTVQVPMDINIETLDVMSLEDVGILESSIYEPQIEANVKLAYVNYLWDLLDKSAELITVSQYVFVLACQKQKPVRFIIRSGDKHFLAEYKDKAYIREINKDLLIELPEDAQILSAYL